MRHSNSGVPSNPHQSPYMPGRPSSGYEQQFYDVSMRNQNGHAVPQYVYYTHRGGPGPAATPGSYNIPQTPFDPAYGVTLLPSHLLIGSPFVSTPQTSGSISAGGRPSSRSNSTLSFRNNSYKQFYPPAPKLRPAPSGRTKKGMRKSKNSLNLEDSNAEDEGVEVPYLGSGTGIRSQPIPISTTSSFSAERRNTGESLQSEQRYNNTLVDPDTPVRLSYTILPKGSDIYRSRSLLFTNVNPEVDLLEFLQKVSKNYLVESVYSIPQAGESKEKTKAEITTNDKNKNHTDINTENEDKDDASPQSSYLLSFLSKETCLDFYNNLLQRYAEIKQSVKSEKLSMNFVKIQDDEEWVEGLKVSALSMGATKSLYVEFRDDKISSESFYERLPFLKDSPRYIVLHVDIVDTDEKRKHFGSNYCLLHFLSLSAALEVKDLLETTHETVSRVSFVIPTNQLEGEAKRSSSTISLKQENFPGSVSESRSRASNTSLPLSEQMGSATTSDPNLPLYEGAGKSLSWITLTVNHSDYKEPSMNEHSHHLSAWSMSKPTMVYLREPRIANFSSSNLSDEVDPLSVSGQEPASQSMMINEYPYVMEQLMPPQITQTIQSQYNKSIQAVSAGMEHRTVFIGNINPRSKPEDICNVVRGGILQHVKWVAHKRICFVTFIETAAAVQFYANAILEPIVLHGNVLKVGWGQNPGTLPKKIALAVTVGASRNVYISLPDKAFKDKYMNDPEFEEYRNKYKLPDVNQLKEDFGMYGAMEQINFHPDGHCCWINFMNINSAIKLVEEYSDVKRNVFNKKTQGRYEGLIIGYGKDRCGNVNKNLAANKNSKGNQRFKAQSNSGFGKGRRNHRQSFDSSKNSNGNSRFKAASDAQVEHSNFLTLNGGMDFSEGLGITVSPERERSHVLSDVEKDIDDENDVDKDADLDHSIGENKSARITSAIKQENGSKMESKGNDEVQIRNKEHVSKEEDGEEEEGDDQKADFDSESSYSGSSSSDIDIIVDAPSPNMNDINAFAFQSEEGDGNQHYYYDNSYSTRHSPHHSGQYYISNHYQFQHVPQQQYHQNQHHHHHHQHHNHHQQHQQQPFIPQTPYRFSNSFTTQNNHRRGSAHGKSKKSAAKPIAGSDVMTRYLEQLHHNTFVYAANILGATQDPVFYDENNL
ncbi:RNA-binding protein NAB6 [Kluyveromyces marxianus]|nr:RNA-binding protein NAB6 [Kluyveromyces marxianus]